MTETTHGQGGMKNHPSGNPTGLVVLNHLWKSGSESIGYSGG